MPPADIGRLDRREHQEDAEQEERDRRHKVRALTLDITAGEFTGLPGKKRERSPDLPLKVHQAIQKIMDQGPEGPADVRMLPAGVTIFADQFGAAIEAMGLVCASVSSDFSGARRDGPAEQTARHGIAKRLKLAHALPPYPRH